MCEFDTYVSNNFILTLPKVEAGVDFSAMFKGLNVSYNVVDSHGNSRSPSTGTCFFQQKYILVHAPKKKIKYEIKITNHMNLIVFDTQ